MYISIKTPGVCVCDDETQFSFTLASAANSPRCGSNNQHMNQHYKRPFTRRQWTLAAGVTCHMTSPVQCQL